MRYVQKGLLYLSMTLAGCAGDGPAAAASRPFKRLFVVTNQLLAPISISIDDTATLILQNGQSGPVTVSPVAQWLTWTSAKATDFNGIPIPDDIGVVRIPVAGIGDTLQI